MARSQAKNVITLAGLTAVYVAAGKLGLSLAFLNESASAVWPPTGIALAACLVLGFRVWPALALGAFAVNLTTSGSVAASIAIATGNTLEGVAGAWLIMRYANGRDAFDSARDTFRFALCAAIATAIAASIGSATLAAAGLAGPPDVAAVFVTWWVGDLVGAMLIAPPVLLWRSSSTAPNRRPVETVLLCAMVAGVSWFVFGDSPVGVRRYPLEFLTISGLLWGAFRFGAFATSIASAATSVVAVWGTLRGYGPFARSSPNESLLLLQAFMGCVSTVMLAVAAEVAARRSASRSLRQLNDSLEERVASRTEELVKTRDRLTEAQSVAHVGSWEWDITGDSLWWSDELYRIYGIAPGTPASYDTYISHVHPGDRERIDATVRRARADGRPFAFEHRIVRGDGEVKTVSARGRVSLGPDGTAVRMSGVGHDISELKHAEEERAQLIREQFARREAEEANRAKDQFLATLSHELRTPMNAVLGWARMLRQLPLDDEGRSRAVDAIFRNVQIQSQLVSDILDVSRIATTTLSLEPGTVNLAAVIDEAIETVGEAAHAKHVTIVFQRPSPDLELPGDATRVRQVVWNLLANAVKFVGEGGRVSVGVLCRHDALEIVVDDDGPGIAPEFLPHVFDRFRQADGSLTRAHGGLGLGLAIVRHIVELHGGTVAACNRVPHGASFRVRLPLAGAMQEEAT
jgi:PAS domain S-box-containing protein